MIKNPIERLAVYSSPASNGGVTLHPDECAMDLIGMLKMQAQHMMREEKEAREYAHELIDQLWDEVKVTVGDPSAGHG